MQCFITFDNVFHISIKGRGRVAKLITQSEKDRYCVAPFIAGPWRSQTHRDRAEWGCQGLGSEGT